MAAPAEIGSPGGFAQHAHAGRPHSSDRQSATKKGHRLTHTRGPRSSGKSASDQGAGCRCWGQDALCCAQATSLPQPSIPPNKEGRCMQGWRNSISWQGGDWGTSKGNVEFYIFSTAFSQCIENKLLSYSSPRPSSAHPRGSEPSRAGEGAGGEMGAARPGTTPWPSHFASFCSSFPTRKMGRLFTYLPQAGQQLMSVCKALPAP